MDKVVSKLTKTQENWWTAFKFGMNLRGYDYWKKPDELKYRYPAPGSVPDSKENHPYLFKHNWRTPFKDSPFDVRYIERAQQLQDGATHYISDMPRDLDANNEQDQKWLKKPDTAIKTDDL